MNELTEDEIKVIITMMSKGNAAGGFDLAVADVALQAIKKLRRSLEPAPIEE